VNIGFDNQVPHWRVAAILIPSRSAGKRLRDEAGKAGRLLDATGGRKTRSLVITDANQVICSAVAPETLMARLQKDRRLEACATEDAGGAALISYITLGDLEREGA
jgi:hypothetical protein